MNRIEFIRQLEILLSGISQSEKEEAIQYYNDYFDDAGSENEMDVIKALGSPAKVAETIKAGVSGKNQEDFEFTERGCNPQKNRQNEMVTVEEKSDSAKEETGGKKQNSYQNGYANNQYGNANNQYGGANKKEHPKNDTGKIILIGILLLLFSPVWLPIFFSIFGVLFGFAVALVSIFIALAASSVALIFAGIVIFGVSIAKFFVSPLLGIFMLGASLLVAGFGILLLILTVWIGGTLIPMCFRGVVKLCRMPFEKKGGVPA